MKYFSRFCLSCFLLLFSGFHTVLIAQDIFIAANQFFQKNTVASNIDYAKIKSDPTELEALVKRLSNFDLREKDAAFRKAFWINAYNLLVIQSVVAKYPVRSPKDIPGFFDRKPHVVAGEKLTLSELEKKKILRAFEDPRVHFALVCAARGCPPFPKEAFFPDRVEAQLEAASRTAINDPNFVRRSETAVSLSPIFRWYAADFGSIKTFINRYLEKPIDKQTPIRYYAYDWGLNEVFMGKKFQLPFRATELLQKGEMEIKIFNSIYTQKNLDGFSRPNSRSTYFSSFGQNLFGINEKLNLGFDLVYKSNVLNDLAKHSPFEVLRFQNKQEQYLLACDQKLLNIASNSPCRLDPDLHPLEGDSLRNFAGEVLQTSSTIGLSHFGPKFKINPIRKWTNLSWQQTFYIPIQRKVDGQWVSFSQFFYDRAVGSRFQFFSEISLWTTVAPNFRILPAIKIFYSYFPARRWTFYAMTSIPVEYGVGSKFQLSPKLEMELLYTHYLPIKFLLGDARPNTFNLGFRYRG